MGHRPEPESEAQTEAATYEASVHHEHVGELRSKEEEDMKDSMLSLVIVAGIILIVIPAPLTTATGIAIVVKGVREVLR